MEFTCSCSVAGSTGTGPAETRKGASVKERITKGADDPSRNPGIFSGCLREPLVADLLSLLASARASCLIKVGLHSVESWIVCFDHPDRSTDEMIRDLTKNRVVVRKRAGRVRVAPHYYNTEEELEAVVSAIGA